MTIIKNAAKCLECGEIIESKHRHDFVTCKCGNVSVDGGLAYIRRGFKSLDTWEDLSEQTDDVYVDMEKELAKLAVELAKSKDNEK